MSFAHTPVLLKECLSEVETLKNNPKYYLDLTLGRGGHAQAFLEKYSDLHCFGVDQDLEAIKQTQKSFEAKGLMNRCQFFHTSFHNWKNFAQGKNLNEKFDFILIDLGVSSPQLDDSERGFSFYHDGPLDMRMNQSAELTAADIINTSSEEELNEIFKTLGEVISPSRVTKEILKQRVLKPFTGTLELSKLIEAKEGWRKKGSHPATKYFLALRMAVNNEIEGLENSLPEIIEFLKDQGRLLVLTFHSLEDRLVKYFFKNSKIGFPVHNKVIKPSKEEIEKNPRARSAQLRVFEKGVKNEKRNKYPRD